MPQTSQDGQPQPHKLGSPKPSAQQSKPGLKQAQKGKPGSNQPKAGPKQNQPGKPSSKQPKAGPKQPKPSKPGSKQPKGGQKQKFQNSKLEQAIKDLQRALSENPELRAQVALCQKYLARGNMPIQYEIRAQIVVVASTAHSVKELKAQILAPRPVIYQWLRAFIKRGYEGLQLSNTPLPKADRFESDRFMQRLQGVMSKLR